MPIMHDDLSTAFTIEVRSDGAPEFRIVSWQGREAISEPFDYTIEVASKQKDIDPSKLVGRPVCITLRGYKEDRFVHGVVRRFAQTRPGSLFFRYEMQVVPALWFLSLNQDFRVFQEQSAKDIVTTLLEEVGIKGDDWVSWKTSADPPVREYCVCYGESTLGFISRLLHEEGIFYFFEHLSDSHRLVLGDAPAVHAEISGGMELPFRADRSRTDTGEYVHDITFELSVRPRNTILRDFNFVRPLDELESHCDEAGEQEHDGHPAATKIEVYDYPGTFIESPDGDRIAKLRHQLLRTGRRQVAGTTSCRRLLPGFKFKLIEHDQEALNAEYAVTELRHLGAQPGVLAPESMGGEAAKYEASFHAIPAGDPQRPASRHPKPAVRGVQTALVVGPKGEEIYTDDDGHGRVKVQFHWDRRGAYDEKSSCWLRVAQVWAGNGMGGFFLPRIGQEVLVDFINGDPDRPIVTGVVYNGENRPPLDLPTENTRSTLKSLSSPEGKTFNELRFEDKKDSEGVFLHAGKDLDIRVTNDRREFIGNDRHLIVKRDLLESIENDAHAKVSRHRIAEIGKDDNLKVKGKQAIEVAESLSLTVKGDVIEAFKANHSEQTGGDIYLKGMNVVIEAAMGMTLKCGGNAVVLDPSGVTIKGIMVTVDGSMVKIASGPGSPAGSGSAGSAVAPAAITAALEATTGLLPGKAKPKEQQFQEPDPEDVEAQQKTWIEVELVDENDKGVPGEPFKIITPDGKTVTGTTGPDGIARVIGLEPGTCKISFTNLDKDAWEPI